MLIRDHGRGDLPPLAHGTARCLGDIFDCRENHLLTFDYEQCVSIVFGNNILTHFYSNYQIIFNNRPLQNKPTFEWK